MGKKCFVMTLAVFAFGFGTALRSNAGTDMIEPYRAPAPSYNYAAATAAPGAIRSSSGGRSCGCAGVRLLRPAVWILRCHTDSTAASLLARAPQSLALTRSVSTRLCQPARR